MTRDFSFDLRDQPSQEFIDYVRGRFPTERETDELLTRKLLRRSGPQYRQISLSELVACLTKMLSDVLHAPFTVTDERWLTGGASKVQMAFTLTCTSTDGGQRTDRLVVRMDPSEASATTSRLREVELLRAFDGIVAVPTVLWVDDDAKWFPEPALIYTFVSGVAKPRNAQAGQVVGLGTNFGPALRKVLAPQFLRDLAAVHTADVEKMTLTTMDRPRVGTTEAAQLQLNRARRVWEEDRDEDLPLMNVAAAWLERNLPVLDRQGVVHGDFRSGNFLFDESSGEITAWLDWERGHLGDRHRDLAWLTQREKGHLSEDGKTYLVCGLIPIDEFYDRYEHASGLPVIPETLIFYRVLNCFQIVTTVTATAHRVAKLGKSHQDVLLARLVGVAPVVAAELCKLLEENL